MIDKLSAVENRFEQISIELTRPETINDTATFTKLMKEHSEIYPIVEKFREYKKALEDEKKLWKLSAPQMPTKISKTLPKRN